MARINRITLFRIPEPAHVDEAVRKYSTLTQDAVKVSSRRSQFGNTRTYHRPPSPAPSPIAPAPAAMQARPSRHISTTTSLHALALPTILGLDGAPSLPAVSDPDAAVGPYLVDCSH